MNKITETTTDRLLAGTAAIPAPGPGFGTLPAPAVALAHTPARDPLRPEKVAILGTAPSSRQLAPFNDLAWTIWGSSPGNMGEPGNPNTPNALPRVDAWVEMHSNFDWPEYRTYGDNYVRWLKDSKFPMLAPIDIPKYKEMFPRAKAFPWRVLVEEFGSDFFTSTFAWMMAYAIYVGAKEIGLYGVDMSSKDEYILQRPGGRFFKREAEKRGIKVTIPPESDLGQPSPLYGIVDSTPYGRKIATRKLEIQGRINHTNMQLQQLQQQAAYLSGAMEDADYHAQIWPSQHFIP